jgi:uncharacterized membrane protein
MSDARAPRRWSFWLVASLCLNFFLIGVVVTGLLVARNRMIAGAIGGAGGALPPEVVLQMLPQSGAVKMCNVLTARLENFRRLGRDVIDKRRAMFKAFRSEPFDAAAFRTALGSATDAQIAVAHEREAAINDVVAQLTPEERKHFTRQVAQRFFSLARPPAARQGPGALAAICKSIGANSSNLP